MATATRICPACGKPQGTSADCLSCREVAAQGLLRDAKDVTPEIVGERAEQAGRFLASPPWYLKAAPGTLLQKARLLWMVLRDYTNGSYRQVPWKAVAAIVAGVVYVMTPFDLVPDLLGPLGLTDDVLALALTWGLVKRELRDYCTWKGLAPSHFGL